MDATAMGMRNRQVAGIAPKISIAAALLGLASGAAAAPLTVCIHSTDTITLDPHKQFGEKNHTVVQQIYDGLLRLDPDGKIEPALAESWRRIDELTVEFHLRHGVLFHNGEPFDAESVRFSLDRYLDPATDSPAKGFLETIRETVIVDSHTVRIVTHVPDGLILHRFAALILVVPPRHLRSKGPGSLADHPIGTGAFRFLRRDRGDRIVLEANPDYWMRGYPKAGALTFAFLPVERQLAALSSGRVDLLPEVPGTQTLAIRKHPRLKIVKKPIYYTVGVTLRTADGPLADRRVRLALNYALNKSDLIRYDLLGNGSPLASFSFPGEFGHDAGLQPYPYNPALARRLLKQAGYPGGLTLRALTETSVERTARIVASQLEKTGILLEMTQAPETDALMIELMSRKKFDIGFGGAPNHMLHPFFIQAILLYSKSPYSLNRDSHYDGMLERMARTWDTKEQERLCRALDRHIHEEALSLFTYQRILTSAMRRGLHFQPYVSGMPYFFNVHLDEGGKP